MNGFTKATYEMLLLTNEAAGISGALAKHCSCDFPRLISNPSLSVCPLGILFFRNEVIQRDTISRYPFRTKEVIFAHLMRVILKPCKVA